MPPFRSGSGFFLHGDARPSLRFWALWITGGSVARETFNAVLACEGQATVHHYRLGDECLDYVCFEGVDPVQQQDPGVANSLWFQHVNIVVSDLQRAAEQLMPVVTPISQAPQWLPNGVGHGSFAMPLVMPWSCSGFLLDSAIALAPADAPLFQGLDHTAIAISDSDQSLMFYGVELGLQLRYATLNQGVEQERLMAS